MGDRIIMIGKDVFVVACDRNKPARCVVTGCQHGVERVCDFPLRGKMEGKTCGRGLCPEHARRVGDNDMCPSHANLMAGTGNHEGVMKTILFGMLIMCVTSCGVNDAGRSQTSVPDDAGRDGQEVSRPDGADTMDGRSNMMLDSAKPSDAAPTGHPDTATDTSVDAHALNCGCLPWAADNSSGQGCDTQMNMYCVSATPKWTLDTHESTQCTPLSSSKTVGGMLGMSCQSWQDCMLGFACVNIPNEVYGMCAPFCGSNDGCPTGMRCHGGGGRCPNKSVTVGVCWM